MTRAHLDAIGYADMGRQALISAADTVSQAIADAHSLGGELAWGNLRRRMADAERKLADAQALLCRAGLHAELAGRERDPSTTDEGVQRQSEASEPPSGDGK